MLQFCTALFAFAGTAVGLLFETDAAANGKVLAAVSGGFVYLATMTVLPELLEPLEEDEKDHLHDGDNKSGPGKDGSRDASPDGRGVVTRSARKRVGKGATPAKSSEGTSSSSSSSSRTAPAPVQQAAPWLSKQANAVLVQTCAEAFAFGIGVYMMVLVAKLEMHEH